MKLLTVLCFVLVVSCSGQNNNQSDKISNKDFTSFLNTFSKKTLPLILDRKTVFGLSRDVFDSVVRTYKANHFPEFGQSFSIFLPEEIRKNTPINRFRCLFALPNIYNINPLIIAQDFFQDDEQNALKLFLVSYDIDGKILGSLEIAGYTIDIAEEFAEINEEYTINLYDYRFKNAPDNNLPTLFYLLETQKLYRMENNGTFLKIQENTKEGYFKGNWSGYFLVK
jgi:hypothetical protein